MKIQVFCNDRQRQFALHVEDRPGCPFAETLVLHPMEAAEYRAAKSRGESYRRELIDNVLTLDYQEQILTGDVKDLGNGSSRLPVNAAWVSVGNEGFVPAPCPQTEMVL